MSFAKKKKKILFHAYKVQGDDIEYSSCRTHLCKEFKYLSR